MGFEPIGVFEALSTRRGKRWCEFDPLRIRVSSGSFAVSTLESILLRVELGNPSCLDRARKTLFAHRHSLPMSPEKKNLESLRIDRSSQAKRSPLIWLLAVIAVVAAGVAAVGWQLNRPKPATVRTFVVRETTTAGQKTLLNASGYVTARREATVSSKVTGKVMEILIEEGMKVAENQILARLDSSNTKANLDLAQAQQAAAQSAIHETKVRFDEAHRELRRITDLAKEKIATQADLDRADAEVNSLKARLERQQVEVSVAERQVALWQQQMEDAVIRAPFAGVVTSKNAQPGEMISPISAGGGFTRTGICTLVDMDSLEVEIDVSESYINRVEANQPVEATLDAYADWKIPCKVIAIIPTADRQKATVKVRVGFEKLDPRILPQMGIKVAFQGSKEGEPAKGIVIPKGAVRSQDGQDIVFVMQNGRVERRAITLGSSGSADVTVAAGLTAGERVVLEGPENLTPGAAVEETKQ